MTPEQIAQQISDEFFRGRENGHLGPALTAAIAAAIRSAREAGLREVLAECQRYQQSWEDTGARRMAYAAVVIGDRIRYLLPRPSAAPEAREEKVHRLSKPGDVVGGSSTPQSPIDQSAAIMVAQFDAFEQMRETLRSIVGRPEPHTAEEASGDLYWIKQYAAVSLATTREAALTATLSFYASASKDAYDADAGSLARSVLSQPAPETEER